MQYIILQVRYLHGYITKNKMHGPFLAKQMYGS